MKKLVFAMLVLISACQSKDQSSDKNLVAKNVEIMFPFRDTSFKWKNIEKRNDEVKIMFMKVAPGLLKDEYAMYSDTSVTGKPRLDELKSALHAVDFDGDGRDDLMYDGYSGGEPNEVALIHNTDNGFKVIFKEQQQFARIVFNGNKIKELYVSDNGCCAATMIFNKIYTANLGTKEPTFKRTYFTGHDSNTYIPHIYLKKSYRVEVLNNNYKIRFKPLVDDTCTTYRAGEPSKGNVLGELSKGSVGRAIASQTDNTGRVWLLVEMEPNSAIKSSILYDDDRKNKSGKLGWISSRFVKKIE